jgi:hypothetical protein
MTLSPSSKTSCINRRGEDGLSGRAGRYRSNDATALPHLPS